MSPVLLAFIVCTAAGLATGIGSLFAFLGKANDKRFLSAALGFSAGVMIYVSFIEIFPKAWEMLSEGMGEQQAHWLTFAGFFVGVILAALIDRMLPHDHESAHPHDVYLPRDMDKASTQSRKESKLLLRTGIFTAVAVAIHNFPEGLVTFMAVLQDPAVGIAIAIAIALHNIPEGIAIAVPVYHATGSRVKAFWYSFISGLFEPLGALVGYLLLIQFASDAMIGIIFAAVGGIMVFISFDKLLPTASRFGYQHLSMYGMFAGMAIMGVSLVLLG